MFTSLLLGCSSSSYKIDAEDKGRKQLLVTPNRVKLECYHLTDYEGEIKSAHMFSIYVLDESKTVLSVSQSNIFDKEVCFERLNEIDKILKSGNKIYIGGIGNLDKPREAPKRHYSFPGIGQFPDNGRNLQFIVIWNEKGQCFNAFSGDQKPCPSAEFPIVKGMPY